MGLLNVLLVVIGVLVPQFFFGEVDSISGKYLMGKLDYGHDSRFIMIDSKYASQKGFFMRKEAYQAFIKMEEAALKDGVVLKIISAVRGFDEQKTIWNAKWSGERLVEGKNLSKTVPDPYQRALMILKFSSMPGCSRHHWGTDIDLNSLENSYFLTGKGKNIYNWLKTNASQYGFSNPYCEKGDLRQTGYEEEKWHWSFIPLSVKLLSVFKEKVKYQDFIHFKGCEEAEKVGIIENYVFGLNPDCK